MLSSAFSPEQEDFRVQLRKFAVAELAPQYIERDVVVEEWLPQLIAGDVVTFGNLGYSTEMPLQQRYRDVASYLIADGTPAVRKRIIATAMMGKVAAL
jgi:hypothetical protein